MNLQGFVMLPSELKLLIRADASPQIGTGNITRCLSLAKAWRGIGGQASFVCGEIPGRLQRSISNNGFPFYSIAHADCAGTDARETSEIAIACEPDWIVLDGERFDDSYQSKLRHSSARLMVIDDIGRAQHFAADLIVKQFGLKSREFSANATSSKQVLSGLDFFLARDDSVQPHSTNEEKHVVVHARRILVAMGDAAETRITLQILETLGELHRANLVVDLVVAPDYPYIDKLRQFKKTTSINLRCHRNLDRATALLKRIDLAITSAETSCIDLVRLGIPAILLTTNSNQVPLAREMDRMGAAIHNGPANEFDDELFLKRVRSVLRNADLRQQMAIRGPQIVDGQGAPRIARRLAAQLFELRPADITDANSLHSWRNEPEYRALSFSSQPISLASHHTWLERKLKSSDSIIWIASNKSGSPIGTIAVDLINSETANLAICLCPTQRGRGLGPIMIEKASFKLLREHDVGRILVQFKPANAASQHAFKKAGYRPIAPTIVNGLTAFQMVFERDGHNIAREAVPALRKSA